MHVTELTMGQYDFDADSVLDSNRVFNVTTWPGIPYEFSPWQPDNLPPGSELVGFRGTCALAGSPEGGKFFREASWLLESQDTKAVETASVVRVHMHLKNDVQELNWVFDAKRCDAVMKYFQNVAGNHIWPSTIDCVRQFTDMQTPQRYLGPPINAVRPFAASSYNQNKAE